MVDIVPARMPRATRAGGLRPPVVLALLVALLMGTAAAGPQPTAASTVGPLVVIIVGPVGGQTGAYIRDARAIARQVRAYGGRVREVYSPRATWARVRAAATGANLLVYLGHGLGTPAPYGPGRAATRNGFGLNTPTGGSNWRHRFYGEAYMERLRLAPGAVVLLDHVCYAAGSSEPIHRWPTRRTATQRADNYASGFLRAGAVVVYATDRSPRTIVQGLFRSGRTFAGVFWAADFTSGRYDSAFSSRRTAGARGILAPYLPGLFRQSVVGHVGVTATEWRASWAPTLSPPSPAPSPEPSSAPTPDPAAAPTSDPAGAPAPDPSADPTPVPTSDPLPTPSPAVGAPPAP